MKNKILIVTVALSISFILTNGHARKMSEGLKSQVERVKKYISETYSVNDLKEEWSKDNTYIISYGYESITKLRTKDNNFKKRMTPKNVTAKYSPEGEALEILYVEKDKFSNMLYLLHWGEHFVYKKAKLEHKKWELIEEEDYEKGDYGYYKAHYYSKDKLRHKFLEMKFSKKDVTFISKTIYMREEINACSNMEVDAENAINAISSYFADPSREKLPTINQLKKEEDLYTEFPIEIKWTNDQDIMVHVIDNNDRCPKGKIYSAKVLGGARKWNN